MAKGRGAVVVEPAVERIRHPDGALTYVDTVAYRTFQDGPLSVLRELLDLEARTVRSWSKGGFARFHKHSAAKRVEQICREQGSEAAADWALANATNDRLDVDELRDALGPRLFTAGGRDEGFYRAEIGRCIEHRRRQRLARD